MHARTHTIMCMHAHAHIQLNYKRTELLRGELSITGTWSVPQNEEVD